MILCVNLNPCVDRTLYVDRLRVGEIQAASRSTVTVGGKANNVARVLAAFGHRAVAMNFLGAETGKLCERLLKDDDHLETLTVWTRHATREIITISETAAGPGEHHTDIKEPGPVILEAEREELMSLYEDALGDARWVAFGGSAPCPSTCPVAAEMCRLARLRGVRFVLDTSGTALAMALDEKPFLVKPNRAEAQALFGVRIDSLDDALDALARFSKHAEVAILSMGHEGFVAAYEGLRYRVRPPAVETVNAVGSGDALVAGVIMGLSQGLSFAETLALAAAAAAANAASPLACRIAPADVAPLVERAVVTEV